MRYDPWNLNAQARLQPDGTLLGFKQRVRSCRRWQLNGLQLDLRGALPLDMPLRFRDPRRSQVTPETGINLMRDHTLSVMIAHGIQTPRRR